MKKKPLKHKKVLNQDVPALNESGQLSPDGVEPGQSLMVETMTENQRVVYECACQVVAAGDKLRSKYYELCSFVRKYGMTPKDVAPLLAAAGFIAPRISEICAVSQVGDDVWEGFQTQSLGWKMQVVKAREHLVNTGSKKSRKASLARVDKAKHALLVTCDRFVKRTLGKVKYPFLYELSNGVSVEFVQVVKGGA